MTIYLVRHAAAGDRSQWDKADWLRPLSARGRSQARGLLQLLHDARFARIISSPYVRCSETVLPIAGAHGLPIELDDALAEGADEQSTYALVKQCQDDGAVLCSHGDMIPIILEMVAAQGVDVGPRPRCEKGSVWILEGRGGAVTTATYVRPTTDE